MNFHTRDQWGARPPEAKSTINPSSRTTHWNGNEIFGYDGVIADHNRCFSLVRGIQNYHMDHNGWSDIAYNGVVCPHGFLFEGRGYGIRSAANGTNSANSQSEAFCYLGGQNNPFTNEGKSVFAELGVTLGHRDWYNTACPGDEIYGWIQSGATYPQPTPGPVPVPIFDIGIFPLSAGHWYGPPNSNPKNHSGYYWANDRPGIYLIQEAMARLGRLPYEGIDGRYGPNTSGVIRQFQTDVDPSGNATGGIDGLTGAMTWQVVREHSYG